MRIRIILLALVASLLAVASAPAAVHGPLQKPHPKTPCGPAVSTTAKAHHRAQRGWDSKRLITRQGAIDQVRLQARCVPEGKPERFVRGQIDKARKQLKKALKAAENPWPEDETTLPHYDELYDIAGCESGHDPGAVDPSGTYYGLFQFDTGTWASVGGSGVASSASVEEQYWRADTLMSQAGHDPWPVCG